MGRALLAGAKKAPPGRERLVSGRSLRIRSHRPLKLDQLRREDTDRGEAPGHSRLLEPSPHLAQRGPVLDGGRSLLVQGALRVHLRLAYISSVAALSARADSNSASSAAALIFASKAKACRAMAAASDVFNMVASAACRP